jgi:acyl-CoA hydrolase
MGPVDTNIAGVIHGGTVMKLADEAAGIAAIKHSGARVATVSLDRMTFLIPIRLGELVTFTATVNAAWNTSMEVGVRVDAEDPRAGTTRHASTAYLTMVAVDRDDRPLPVPVLSARTPIEQRRMREADQRRAQRLAEREETRARRALEESI